MNHYFQALVYRCLDIDAAQWLHNTGYRLEDKAFKHFTFSTFLEQARFNPRDKIFHFPREVSFYVSSPLEWLCDQLASNMSRQTTIHLGGERAFKNLFTVASVEKVHEPAVTLGAMQVRAITPIEVHSTFRTSGNKRKTYYYNPFEKEFSLMVEENLQRKWQALYRRKCPFRMRIRPLFPSTRKDLEKIIYFGNGPRRTLVKGWTGRFVLEGDPEFLAFGYDCGLGSRNSQGFGLVGKMEGRRGGG